MPSLYTTAALSFRVYLYLEGSTYAYTKTSTTLIPDTWYHLAMVSSHHPTERRIQLYINGDLQELSTDDAGQGQIDVNTNNLIIGNINNDNWFNGVVDEVRVYDRALTKEELIQSMNSRYPMKDVVASYSFENPTDRGSDTHFIVKGQYDGALQLNGVDEYVDIGNQITLDYITAGMWLKTNELPFTEWKHPLGMFEGTDRPIELEGFTSQSNFRWHVKTAGGSDTLITNNLPGTEWNHIAVTYDGINMNSYINGDSGTPKTHNSGGVINGLPDVVFIGNRPDLGYGSWNGLIDEVKIMDKAIS